MKEGCGNGPALSVTAVWGETGGRAPLLGSPKDRLSKAPEMVVCFHRGPILGNMGGGTLLYRGLQENGEILFLSGELLWGIQETCKRKLWKWTNLSIRAPAGEPGGGSFTGPFERQMENGSGNVASLINLIWAPFVNPYYVRSLSLGAIWNCSDGPRLPWLGIRVWGTKGLF